MSYPEYGPGLNGWPAHGFTDMRDSHVVCYCGVEFTSKMALNQHSEAEAVAAERERIRAAVEGLDGSEFIDDYGDDDRPGTTYFAIDRAAVLRIIEGGNG